MLLLLSEGITRVLDWSSLPVFERNPEWYETDAMGFRQPSSPLGALPDGIVRLTVLGGDETWGPGVPASELWTVRLEKEFSGRLQVLNRALLGANVAGSAAAASVASGENPRAVLWAISPAMLLDVPDTLGEDEGVVPRWWRFGRFFERMLVRGRYAAAQSRSRDSILLERGGTPQAPGISLLAGSLDLMAASLRLPETRLMAFIVPDFGQDRDYRLMPVHEEMRRVFEKKGIPVFDPVREYRAGETRLLRLDDRHFVPNDRGHGFLAGEAAKALRESGLLY